MFRFSNRLLCSLVVPAAALAIGASSARAVTVPFTEDFTAGANNWMTGASTSSSFAPITQVAGGGPAGASDAYGSYTRSMTGTTATSTVVVFRGQDGYDSSGDAFVGDWTNGKVTQLSLWVRQDSSVPLTMGVRLATSANFPAFSILGAAKVQPNQWTQLTFPISEAASASYLSEGGTFAGVFGALANIQVFAYQETLANPTNVTFGLDKVQVVPEPAGLGVLGGLGLAGLLARRRRRS